MATESKKNKAFPASFRDPSGFIFFKDGKIFRQINQSYKENFDLLVNSGLIKKLFDRQLLIRHREVKTSGGYKTIQPEMIPFVSYPHEWSFSQLKDAALLTLEIQKTALEFGLSLKDASAYNVQFLRGKPILIDTLSFEKYEDNKPWVAYKQFCQHFLAPLALASLVDLRMLGLSANFIDGWPLDLAAKILPTKSKFSLGLLTHIHFHAKSQAAHAGEGIKDQKFNLSKSRQIVLLENLRSAILSLKFPEQKTVWGDYYQDTNYSRRAFRAKEKIVAAWGEKIKLKSIWDAGGNDGHFAKLAANKNIFILASDFDQVAIEKAYNDLKNSDNENFLPLVIDLTNPSPAIGWENKERDSFLQRADFDLTLALALIHHLAIANNLSFSKIAEFFAATSKHLIIEFVPKEDSNTQRLLASREDIFSDYDQDNFEQEFGRLFKIIKKEKIVGSLRTMYLMENSKIKIQKSKR